MTNWYYARHCEEHSDEAIYENIIKHYFIDIIQ